MAVPIIGEGISGGSGGGGGSNLVGNLLSGVPLIGGLLSGLFGGGGGGGGGVPPEAREQMQLLNNLLRLYLGPAFQALAGFAGLGPSGPAEASILDPARAEATPQTFGAAAPAVAPGIVPIAARVPRNDVEVSIPGAPGSGKTPIGPSFPGGPPGGGKTLVGPGGTIGGGVSTAGLASGFPVLSPQRQAELETGALLDELSRAERSAQGNLTASTAALGENSATPGLQLAQNIGFARARGDARRQGILQAANLTMQRLAGLIDPLLGVGSLGQSALAQFLQASQFNRTQGQNNLANLFTGLGTAYPGLFGLPSTGTALG